MTAIFLEGSGDKGKRAILLLHAYTGSPADVNLLGNALNRQGYTVYMPELRGHGTKDIRNVLAYSPMDWVEDTHRALADLTAKGFNQVAVFGLSLGGLLTMNLLSENHPEIIGGGSFNSPLPIRDLSKIERQFLSYGQMLYKPEMGDKAAYDAFLAQAAGRQQEALQALADQVAEHLNRIECPVYIAQSGKDELIDPEIGIAMPDWLPFASVDFHYFPEATHVITVGKFRREFNETVLAFANGLDWRM